MLGRQPHVTLQAIPWWRCHCSPHFPDQGPGWRECPAACRLLHGLLQAEDNQPGREGASIPNSHGTKAQCGQQPGTGRKSLNTESGREAPAWEAHHQLEVTQEHTWHRSPSKDPISCLSLPLTMPKPQQLNIDPVAPNPTSPLLFPVI